MQSLDGHINDDLILQYNESGTRSSCFMIIVKLCSNVLLLPNLVCQWKIILTQISLKNKIWGQMNWKLPLPVSSQPAHRWVPLPVNQEHALLAEVLLWQMLWPIRQIRFTTYQFYYLMEMTQPLCQPQTDSSHLYLMLFRKWDSLGGIDVQF